MKTYIFAAAAISVLTLGAPLAHAGGALPRSVVETTPQTLPLIQFETVQGVRKTHPTDLKITVAPQPAGTIFTYNALWGDEGGKPTDDHSEFYVASSTRTATTSVVMLSHTYRKAGVHKVLLTIQSSTGAILRIVSHIHVRR